MEGKKRALLQEFDSRIGPMKLELSAKLPALWKLYSSSTLGSGSRPGVKRSAAVLEKPLTAEHQQQLEGLMGKCEKLLSKIVSHAKSHWFRQPVNLKDVPTYLNFVTRAMDLGTIRSNMRKNAYRTPMDFHDDVSQVWENCAAYNGTGTPCRNDGEFCRSMFLSAWKDMKIEEEWKKLQVEIDPSEAPLQDRIMILNTQLAKVLNAIPATNQPPGPGRDMTFVEKRKLSTQLSRLQAVPDLLKGVLDIVSGDPFVSACSEGELEIELDQLKPETLWKLHALVASKPTPAAQSKPAAPPPPSKVQAAEKKPPASAQTSGAGSDSDSGEHSPNGVKGSTLDDPLQGVSLFAKDRRNMVDESATNPKEPSLFVKDRVAAQKPDVNINSANWQSLTEAPTDTPTEAPTDAGTSEADGGDEMWKSFKSIAEQKQQREEDQRKEAERIENQKREEQEKAKREEEERAKKLREEEERLQADMQRQREEQKEKELAEVQAKAGTANLSQPTDMGVLSSMSLPAGDLAAEIPADDEDMAFDEDD